MPELTMPVLKVWVLCKNGKVRKAILIPKSKIKEEDIRKINKRKYWLSSSISFVNAYVFIFFICLCWYSSVCNYQPDEEELQSKAGYWHLVSIYKASVTMYLCQKMGEERPTLLHCSGHFICWSKNYKVATSHMHAITVRKFKQLHLWWHVVLLKTTAL